MAEQEERIESQVQEIQELKQQAEAKNQQLKELNQAVNKLLVRLAEADAYTLPGHQVSEGRMESEVNTLREQVSRIEIKLSQASFTMTTYWNRYYLTHLFTVERDE
ncbi:hypothetical protein RSOLAG1IB_10140 [Rhizoctonia solani AG-1 IB]|uniref:Uncharacterized protein n=1 Tax=Thanatephorus cucumeris (strain AG1-IB / isolate 7/3/14) TaxID=1108050 RepID=A0A0B7FUI0_THACB|nr:hypothetical protein RSOLAG1IB_10140 [Rhizoctonia solani AG-1 IB]